MTLEELREFNFLEAAARVILSRNKMKEEPCILPYRRSFIKEMKPMKYLVRYKRGRHFVVAHIGENRVSFSRMHGRGSIHVLSMKDVEAYLQTRRSSPAPRLFLVDKMG